jgi:hypothetical protein
MRDVLVIAGVIAFFLIGAAYIALCARILADAGDIDEPNADDADADADLSDGHEAGTAPTVAR